MINTKDEHLNTLNENFLENMTSSAYKLHEQLQEQGYVTVCNNVLTLLLRTISGAHEGKCFMVTEGFADHFILNIHGARTLYSKLISDQEKEHQHREYRVPMNRVALAQIEALIKYMEDKDEYN